MLEVRGVLVRRSGCVAMIYMLRVAGFFISADFMSNVIMPLVYFIQSQFDVSNAVLLCCA